MKLKKIYQTTDVHIAGEVFRIIHHIPFIHYRSIGELNEKLSESKYEEISFIIKEPRGFLGITGCLVVPPVSKKADAAAIFFNHEGMVSTSYSGVAAIVTALLENGHLKERPSGEYFIETVKGITQVLVEMEQDQAIRAEVDTGQFSVQSSDLQYSHTAYTLVKGDLLYALFDNTDVGIGLELNNLSELREWCQQAIQVLAKNCGVDRVVIMDSSMAATGRMRALTFRRDGWIVRSPDFGATAACWTHIIKKLGIDDNQLLQQESIFGSVIKAMAFSENECCRFRLSTRGFVTGMHSFMLDPTDPLPDGFLLK